MDAAESPSEGAETGAAGAESTALTVFAAELRAQRQARGWTQVNLGDKIGFSGSFVSDVERCERTPSMDLARACDRQLGLPGSFERLHELIRRDAYPAVLAVPAIMGGRWYRYVWQLSSLIGCRMYLCALASTFPVNRAVSTPMPLSFDAFS